MLVALVAGCNANYPTAPDPTLAAVRIHFAAIVQDLLPNNTERLLAYAVDSDGVYTDVTTQAIWSTSDSGVLSTLVQNGAPRMRGISAGDADLIVDYGGRTDIVTVRVHPFPRTVPRLEMQLAGGSSALSIYPANRLGTLTVSVQQYTSNAPQNITSAAVITTSDSSVAIVEGTAIRPVRPGTFRILASYNGLTATALASVSPASQASLR